MVSDVVLFERHGPVGLLTLNRPAKANALNTDMRSAIRDQATLLGDDPSVKVLVLTGAGRHFCGGADLREDSRQREAGRRGPLGLDRIDQPVIAAINGSALGGGCELALCCDFRFMSHRASIGLPEIQFGELPRGGGTARLPRLVGLANAKMLTMTGLPVGAPEALRLGLVDRMIAPDELLAESLSFAALLAERPGYALKTAKTLLNSALETDLSTALAAERHLTAGMATREERAQARLDAATRAATYSKIFGAGGVSMNGAFG